MCVFLTAGTKLIRNLSKLTNKHVDGSWFLPVIDIANDDDDDITMLTCDHISHSFLFQYNIKSPSLQLFVFLISIDVKTLGH